MDPYLSDANLVEQPLFSRGSDTQGNANEVKLSVQSVGAELSDGRGSRPEARRSGALCPQGIDVNMIWRSAESHAKPQRVVMLEVCTSRRAHYTLSVCQAKATGNAGSNIKHD